MGGTGGGERLLGRGDDKQLPVTLQHRCGAENVIRKLRYMLTRLFFLCMGLRVSKYRKEVEALWALPEAERNNELERLLRKYQPLNAAGEEVTSLAKLFSSPPLSKQTLREQDSQGSGKKIGRFGRHTAGTTGEPTHVSLSRSELGRMLGVRDYCFRHYGVKLGEREARLWGRREAGGIKQIAKNFVMNRRVFHPVGMNSVKDIEQLLEWSPDYLYGYSSLLLEAARILYSEKVQFNSPRCVVCTAETILPSQKAFISKVFKAPVAEEYGTTEFDIIAFECSVGHRHLVNPWLIVSASGDSILVSDVSRRSQMLINYQQGDAALIESNSCNKLGDQKEILCLEGRSINRFAFVTRSDKFHSVAFADELDAYMKKESVIFGFVVLQKDYGVFEIALNTHSLDGLESIEEYVANAIEKRTGFKISVCCTIDNNPFYGKKGYFVQNIHS
ncbi:CoF synthetase [Marinobacter sp. TBZ242]|uniref:CoF synthetase n=1 Tax=Marinobacter azerbaijanicus TaxID=3050455 RepID=A0ABT7I7S3_9GAMM|nr:CoF synthetase [Marinobacter sp. TBZ242]MDL0429720.1 CoF synthetase [Marinobacter sp. TBZ242]